MQNVSCKPNAWPEQVPIIRTMMESGCSKGKFAQITTVFRATTKKGNSMTVVTKKIRTIAFGCALLTSALTGMSTANANQSGLLADPSCQSNPNFCSCFLQQSLRGCHAFPPPNGEQWCIAENVGAALQGNARFTCLIQCQHYAQTADCQTVCEAAVTRFQTDHCPYA